MKVAFKDARFATLVNEHKRLQKQFGAKGAEVIQRRVAQLEAAASLKVLQFLPGVRCEELKADRAGQLSVRVHDGCRIVFVPQEGCFERRKDGGLDWSSVTAVRILEIVNYHD